MGKIIRVDLSNKKTVTEELGELSRFGGRGLTSMVVSREVPPACHALGAQNKLVIAPGLLTGSNAANSGRLSIGAKSPLTGGIKESNVGGSAAFRIARLGLRGIIIEGKADSLCYLLVNKDGAEIKDAADLAGLKNYELADKLRERHGDKTSVVSIGPAGEFKMSAASIAVTDVDGHPARHAGRGGLGAVMGSKMLKAIVIDDAEGPGVEYSDRDAFKQAAADFRDALQANPVTKSGGGLATFGTNSLSNVINAVGAFPTRNFSAGQFEGVGKISGEALRETIEKRGGKTGHVGCTTCIIHCSNVFVDEKGEYVTSGLEYETVWANGANCGIDDLDAIAQIDRLCDEIGVDTIEIGCAIAVAMEGGVAEFGDSEAAIEMVHEVGKGSPMGRIIGNGAAVTGQAFGVEHVPVVKRQSMPAYDPRSIKGMGATYATSPMGADHTAGYAIASNIMGIGGKLDPLKPDGQAELTKKLQINTAVLDSAGLCTFVTFAITDNKKGAQSVIDMINALHGLKMTEDDAQALGREILKAERAFNRAAGLGKEDDRLPAFFGNTPLAPHNSVFDISEEDLDKVGEM